MIINPNSLSTSWFLLKVVLKLSNLHVIGVTLWLATARCFSLLISKVDQGTVLFVVLGEQLQLSLQLARFVLLLPIEAAEREVGG
jgi:hypothetical protein